MSNQTTYKQGETCGNIKFRYCDVSNATHQCINCEKNFTDDLKDGDIITGRCDECGKINLDIKIHTRYKDGDVEGDCLECVKNGEAISEVYDRFRGGYYGEEDHDLMTDVEQIADLPKEQLIHFLRAIHYTVER